MDKPSVGDYRYATLNVAYYNEDGERESLEPFIFVVKILDVLNTTVLCTTFPESKIYTIPLQYVYGKWQPNWFWKIFGYK